MSYKIIIRPDSINLNGNKFPLPENIEDGLLTALYRKYVNDYPQFFKMDNLSKLGFIASELLLNSMDEERFVERDDRAVVLCSFTGSHTTDELYQETISDKDNYYPSPSLFVRTLPNIAASEIAIRNHYHGETMFYLMDNQFYPFDLVVDSIDQIPDIKDALYGILEYANENEFIAALFIKEKNNGRTEIRTEKGNHKDSQS